MMARSLFNERDLEAIRKATASAETRTSGEIVPYIVERVVERDDARWRGATLGALGAALIAGVVHAVGHYWSGFGVWWITLPTIVGAGFGYVVTGIDVIARWLIPEDHLERAVRIRAEAAFLEEEVFATRDRTGVLVFLAIFERRALILADEGIHRSVPKETWGDLVGDLTAGIKAGRAAEALAEAIARCGELLLRYEVERRPDDEDELSDDPRIRER
jgi:putative membrane protein